MASYLRKASRAILSTSDRNRIREADGKCVYCNKEEESPYHLTIDHFFPLNMGFWKKDRQRMDITTKDLCGTGNAVSACYDCNQLKHGMEPGQFFEMHPNYRFNFITNYNQRSPEMRSDRIMAAAGMTGYFEFARNDAGWDIIPVEPNMVPASEFDF